MQKSEENDWRAFSIFVRVPEVIAAIPAVAVEMKEHTSLLPITVKPSFTIADVKRYIEELSEATPFDQEISWDGVVLDGEGGALEFEDLHIRDGCVLDLKLHDDCPIFLASWNAKLAAGKSNLGGVEYNTMSISKEAEEDIIEQQDEYEAEIVAEEESFSRERLEYKRQKLINTGTLDTVEVVDFAGPVPKLVGIFTADEWNR